MPPATFDLAASAYQEMLHEGFSPDLPAAVVDQVRQLQAAPPVRNLPDLTDLRHLLWSSIDNESSRDLDQIEFAEQTPGGIRILIGIADVDALVSVGSPVDDYASTETTSVYTPARVFPMLPEALSTDLTSLAPGADRPAVIIEFLVAADGSLRSPDIYRALARNRFQLSYEAIGRWLKTSGPPPRPVDANPDLDAQLKLQDKAAALLRQQRQRLGALVFDRIEARAVFKNGAVETVAAQPKTRATALIEDLMIAANEVMASTLKRAGIANIRRVVKSPERWQRMVAIAAEHGASLPAEADSGALAAFLKQQKEQDPEHYPDLSLSILKLMGPGEYVLYRPGAESDGHFGLAANDYTHATAPNRRFADLVTQRLIKAVLQKTPSPYTEEQLAAIARNCTLREDAARKVERTMGKRAAALAFRNRIGEKFSAVVTGVTPKGVFVRVFDPPIEGRVMRGEKGLDVGDKVEVTLLHTDPEQGFIDFGH
jgi:exoribonuclease-2